ncbi:MAG: dynamin family protein [Anaerolineales bacterium]
MHRKILTEQQEILLNVERHWLTSLQLALAKFGASAEDRATLARSVRQLDELFLLVVVGEFNAGKSAFINALFGKQWLEVGVTPTTSRIQLLKSGPRFERVAFESAVDVYTAPVELLEEINIVDTPGTNAIHREHEALTQEFVPRSDLVLFVTSVDRPFTESERAFMKRIRDWGKKVIVILNKIDILEGSDDVADIEAFIAEYAESLLGFAPEIFPISARMALQAKRAEDDALLAESGFLTVERYIIDTLDEKERIRLKLSNPLGVGVHLTERYLEIIEERLALLRDDFKVLADVERELRMYEEDMRANFKMRLSDVDNVLYEFESRGMAYFDETIRLGRIFDLINRDKLGDEFERQVIDEVPATIEARVNELIDWLVASTLHQWQSVMEYVNSRREKHADHLVGQVGGSFTYDRARMIESVSRVVQQTTMNYDEDIEADRIAEAMQQAVAGAALVEVGAIGLGAIVTTLATTAAADLTGIVAASAIAVMGLFVIPNKRRRLKQELKENIGVMRDRLMHVLTAQFDKELARSLREIEGAIAPYTRFIRSERKHLESARDEFDIIQKWLERQQEEIDSM